MPLVTANVSGLNRPLREEGRDRNRGDNGMAKTRGLFRKIRDTKGAFHAKMGSIKDRNGMDLTETY